jgi:hypothetical protein
LLWFEALRPSEEAVTIEGMEEISILLPVTDAITHPVTDTLTTIQAAVKAGQCRETVASIREHLGCSQARAMEIRRELVAASA